MSANPRVSVAGGTDTSSLSDLGTFQLSQIVNNFDRGQRAAAQAVLTRNDIFLQVEEAVRRARKILEERQTVRREPARPDGGVEARQDLQQLSRQTQQVLAVVGAVAVFIVVVMFLLR